MIYKVQCTTLSSQTLDVVWVERIQIYQVLAPGLYAAGKLLSYHLLLQIQNLKKIQAIDIYFYSCPWTGLKLISTI